MRRARAGLLLLGFMAALVGCSSATDTTATTTTTTNTTVNTPVATTVTVRPTNFLGAVPCSNNTGAMRSYVATLTDTTDSAHPFQLPSSPAAPCSQPIAFEYVIAGHEYSAAVDGYPLFASELTPYAGASSGSRTMLQADGTAASPRWTTSCGAVVATIDVDVIVKDCDPLYDHGGTGATGVDVGLAGSLGLVACTSAPHGTVERFDVNSKDPSLGSILGTPCDQIAQYSSGLKDGVIYTFSVAAYNKGGSLPAYTTTCSATARNGLIVVAACGPLAPAI